MRPGRKPGGANARATVSVRLVDTLSSESSQPGDTFSATPAEPLIVGDRIVAQKGARVTGQVREVVSSGRLSRPALLTMSLDKVLSQSSRYPIETGDLTIKASSHATRNLLIIGGSAGAGAVIGGAAGGGKGAAIGAAAGAGAGTVGAYLTGKREIVLPSETLLTFHVTSVKISPKELVHRLGRDSRIPLFGVWLWVTVRSWEVEAELLDLGCGARVAAAVPRFSPPGKSTGICHPAPCPGRATYSPASTHKTHLSERLRRQEERPLPAIFNPLQKPDLT